MYKYVLSFWINLHGFYRLYVIQSSLRYFHYVHKVYVLSYIFVFFCTFRAANRHGFYGGSSNGRIFSMKASKRDFSNSQIITRSKKKCQRNSLPSKTRLYITWLRIWNGNVTLSCLLLKPDFQPLLEAKMSHFCLKESCIRRWFLWISVISLSV